jgi:hypothetical protein
VELKWRTHRPCEGLPRMMMKIKREKGKGGGDGKEKEALKLMPN